MKERENDHVCVEAFKSCVRFSVPFAPRMEAHGSVTVWQDQSHLECWAHTERTATQRTDWVSKELRGWEWSVCGLRHWLLAAACCSPSRPSGPARAFVLPEVFSFCLNTLPDEGDRLNQRFVFLSDLHKRYNNSLNIWPTPALIFLALKTLSLLWKLISLLAALSTFCQTCLTWDINFSSPAITYLGHPLRFIPNIMSPPHTYTFSLNGTCF